MDIATGTYLIRRYNVKMVIIYCLFVFGFISKNPAVVLAQRGFGLEVHPLSFSAVASPTYTFPLIGNPSAQNGNWIRWKSMTPFGIDDLKSNSFGMGYQGRFGSIGVELHRMAFDLYNESVYAFGFGYVTSDFGIGGVLGSEVVAIPSYGKSNVIFSGVGFWKNIAQKLMIEGVFNGVPVHGSGDFEYDTPMRVSSVIHYDFADGFKLSYAFSAQSDWSEQFLIVFGSIPDAIDTFIAYNLTLATWMFGISVNIKGVNGVYSMSSHQHLGWSRGFGFGYVR